VHDCGIPGLKEDKESSDPKRFLFGVFNFLWAEDSRYLSLLWRDLQTSNENETWFEPAAMERFTWKIGREPELLRRGRSNESGL
jgi:hypothetical protein